MAEEVLQLTLTGWANLLYRFSNISQLYDFINSGEFRKVSGLETKFVSSKEVIIV